MKKLSNVLAPAAVALLALASALGLSLGGCAGIPVPHEVTVAAAGELLTR